MPIRRFAPFAPVAPMAHRAWPAVFLAAVVTVAAARAETTVADAWVRGTVPQQKATGMFATLTSSTGGRLVSVSTPVAAVAEIHEMTMEGSTMKMRALPDGLALPAGKPVELAPGGYHVMLMGLKQPIQGGDTVPLTLVVEDAGGKRETIEVKAAVRTLGASQPHQHQHK